MSDVNFADGQTFYKHMNADGRKWLRAQWAEWPVRVDPANTTNMSFLHGAYRAWMDAGNQPPVISQALQTNFNYMEKHRD